MLVVFMGPLSTAAIELGGAIKAGALDTGMAEDNGNELAVGDGVALETGAAEEGGAGAGVGVKYSVDTTVSASWVATGSPFGLRNVMADMTLVTTVRWRGSITSAVSTLTSCSDARDGADANA